jgi:hypothetical protein
VDDLAFADVEPEGGSPTTRDGSAHDAQVRERPPPWRVKPQVAPGLDALRDAAEAGLIERVWCLSPDRLARAYAYQVLVLDELDRFGVTVAFTDSPGLSADDPQATLLTQVQGVIAEYEKAKIAERYRRGKLFRARAGEVVTWKAPYGYRRIPRSAAHRPSTPRGLRARGRGGEADLFRPRRGHHRARDLPPS